MVDENLLFGSIDSGVTELGLGCAVDVPLMSPSPCCPLLPPSLKVNGSQQELPDAVDG